MPTAIIAEKLSKKYTIRHQSALAYDTLRDSITTFAGKARRRITNTLTGKQPDEIQQETFWALKNVSFEVSHGDRIGIIGRNGAGKSTLLKILARITEPTEGRVRIRGRVASLLEVGTGFHPELTGRENIYLNGAILGMAKAEIRRKFDEIIDFAEIEKFLDTPVKHYSSGMYVRLAFAVAAHLEPEILIVDEVLAVGDAQFQKKCLGKMEDVGKEGRTVLFVSHNMAAVHRLCERAIWLHNGIINSDGDQHDVIKSYIGSTTLETGQRCWIGKKSPGTDAIRLRAVRLLNSAGNISSSIDIQNSSHIEIEYDIYSDLPDLRIGFRLISADGIVVFTSADNTESAVTSKARTPGRYISRCEIPPNLLNEGTYSILNVWGDIPFKEVLFLEEDLLSFHVEQTGGVSGKYAEKWSGVICPKLKWDIVQSERGLFDNIS